MMRWSGIRDEAPRVRHEHRQERYPCKITTVNPLSFAMGTMG